MTGNARFGLKSLILAAALVLAPLPALADRNFQAWINNFQSVAARAGITQKTYNAAFAGVSEPDPEVLRKATYQPEFTTKVWDYLDTRVNPHTVANGRKMASEYSRLLAGIEKRFNVNRYIILAIWSMESNYGSVLENPERLHSVPRALATLAYADPRRANYAQKQLIAALKILQSGDISLKNLTGSWAGAMGHTQFIPTSYLLYAYDADGDGKRDIWHSVPDALATAANLLSKNGWQGGKTWGYETVVPASAAKFAGKTKTLSEWAALGLVRPSGKPFPRGEERAQLKMMGGPNGPGFLMMKNFFVIKNYNASDSYAVAVGLLADEIAGHGGMQQRWPRPAGSMDMKDKFELQTRLKALGYYNGEVDGNFGSGSKAAISAIQSRLGMPANGEPSLQLLERLRR